MLNMPFRVVGGLKLFTNDIFLMICLQLELQLELNEERPLIIILNIDEK
jgi:hypothetical protein